MSESHSSGSYHIELLKGDNWVPWKQRMLAILRDQGLEKDVRKEVKPPTPVKPAEPTKEELEAAEKWKEGDARACTRIELSLGDSEMIHLKIGRASCRERV